MPFYTYRVYAADMASDTVTITTYASTAERALQSFRDAVLAQYTDIAEHVSFIDDGGVYLAINDDNGNGYRTRIAWCRNATADETINYQIEYDNGRGAVSYLRDIIGTLD